VDHGSTIARWVGHISDHILPGTLYLYAMLGNAFMVVDIWEGRGPSANLDPFAQTWLIAQRLLFTAFVGLIAILFVVRRPRVGERAGLLPSLIALAGTNALVLTGLAPITETTPWLTVPGAALSGIGIVFALISLACLGRCFGIFPEARGLVIRGPYAYIRHPLYLAEITAALGGVLSALSPFTVALFGVFVLLQYARAIYEERALIQVFPEYRTYMQRTWRILPGLH
jgi:protein-S-isoprenylcysteine O-methyltransferase Ste14